MRQVRSKAYRKLMAMYSTSFGFRQPYQVLGAFSTSSPARVETLSHLLTPPPTASLISGLWDVRDSSIAEDRLSRSNGVRTRWVSKNK